MAAHVQFSTATGTVYDAGSYAQLRLTSDTIYGLPEHRVLGRDVNHRWITAAGEFLRLDVAGRLSIHFEGNGEASKLGRDRLRGQEGARVRGPYEQTVVRRSGRWPLGILVVTIQG